MKKEIPPGSVVILLEVTKLYPLVSEEIFHLWRHKCLLEI